MTAQRETVSNNAPRSRPVLVDDSLFRTLIEYAADTMFLIDLETEECVYVSPSIVGLLGRDQGELIGRPLTDFVHPDDAAEVHARSDRRRSGWGARSTLTRMSSSDDRWVWVQATASPVFSYQGRTATVFTASAASERVQAEVGLRNARTRLSRLLGEIGAGEPRSPDGGSYDLPVELLAAALELRDDETGQHARRVTELALALTRCVDSELSANPELRCGYLLHDIGKIGIPDSILLNRGVLSTRDIRTLRMHTTLGEHLIAFIPFLSSVAHDVVAFHHERWDGNGYPWGLSGVDIPLPARIFAVVDAFDAITNDRPFRSARPVETATALLRAGAGSQFDPSIVDTFLSLAFERESQAAVPNDGRGESFRAQGELAAAPAPDADRGTAGAPS